MPSEMPMLQEISERLERLERRLAALGEVVGTAVQGLTGKATLGKVYAEEFVLRDSEGRMRGALCLRDDNPALALYDAEGDTRAVLRLEGEGQGLYLNRSHSTERAILRVEPNGTVLGLSDNAGFSVAIGSLTAVARPQLETCGVSPSQLFPQAIIVMQGENVIWSAPPPPKRPNLISRLFGKKPTHI